MKDIEKKLIDKTKLLLITDQSVTPQNVKGFMTAKQTTLFVTLQTDFVVLARELEARIGLKEY